MRPGTPIVLMTDPGREGEASVRLARIGFDNVVGALANPIEALIERPELAEPLSRLSAVALADRMITVPGLQIIDVRNDGELAAGTIPGSRHVPLPTLLEHLDELDPAAPTVVHCAGGYRSAIGASLLRSHGFADVSDLLGGYGAWAGATAG
jgi:rhodanese-related sulfurtransferase